MKNVVLLVGVLSMVGCAVGSNDPTGDENLGTEQGGATVSEPASGATAGGGATSANDQQAKARTSALDPTPQIIPNRPGRGPASPGPGPVQVGPSLPH